MKDKLGLVHIYCGDGKGKTTMAMGLALRAIGSGLRVAVVQFLKDGSSGEITALGQLPGVRLITHGSLNKFSFQMNPEEREECSRLHLELFAQAAALCESGQCDLLILDEIIGALNCKLLDAQPVLEFLHHRPEYVEIVMTGRDPAEELLATADYVSNVQKLRHPYDRGIGARQGIER